MRRCASSAVILACFLVAAVLVRRQWASCDDAEGSLVVHSTQHPRLQQMQRGRTSHQPQRRNTTICTPPRQLILAVGIITAPNNFDRRVWIRQKLRVTEARCRGIRVLFVLGSRNHMTRSAKIAVKREQRMHGDVIFVPARDYLPHAVAEKSLAWWQYAATWLPARWYAKTDDDSLAHLPRLERDLQVVIRLSR